MTYVGDDIKICQSARITISEDEEGYINNENDSSEEDVSLQNEIISIPFLEALKEKRKKTVGDT